jgi:hypothetical protein
MGRTAMNGVAVAERAAQAAGAVVWRFAEVMGNRSGSSYVRGSGRGEPVGERWWIPRACSADPADVAALPVAGGALALLPHPAFHS